MRSLFAVMVLALALTPERAEAQWRSSVLPVLGSAPETGGQFGVAIFRTRQPEDTLRTRPSSLIGNAIVTSKGQKRAFLEYDRWTPGNERRLQFSAIASRFPLPFYGYGDDTPDEPIEYEPTTYEMSVTFSRKSGPSSWRYSGLRFVDTRSEGLVFTSGNSGPPCDIEPCPIPGGICDCAPLGPGTSTDYQLGLLTLGRIRDSRDNLFAPRNGRVFDISISGGFEWNPGGLENRDFLARIRTDWRNYDSLPGGSVLAAQVASVLGLGFFPIDQVAMVGHHSLNRGYTMGRFRDESMLSAQAEWRSPTRAWNDRLGFAVFTGVAIVGGFNEFTRPLPSGGAGLRYRLDPRTRSTIRVDYAVGASGQKGLYVAFNEAF